MLGRAQRIRYHSMESASSRRGDRSDSSIYKRLSAVKTGRLYSPARPTTGAWGHTPESIRAVGRITQFGRGGSYSARAYALHQPPTRYPSGEESHRPANQCAARPAPTAPIYTIEQYHQNAQGGATVAAFAPNANFLFYFLAFFCFTLWFGDQQPTQAGPGENTKPPQESQPRRAKKTTKPPTDARKTSRYPQGELPYGRYTLRRSVFYSYPFYLSFPINSIFPTE